MIVVKVEKENNVITNITLNGHAKYDDYGKDIVCASVSTMLITTVNAIIEIDKDAIKYDNENKFVITNLKKDDITNKLLDNLYNLLKELEGKYKKNIQIKE